MQIGVIGLGRMGANISRRWMRAGRSCVAASLFVRFRSRQEHIFAEKVLSATRCGFGGRVEPLAPAP
ncbi:MAG: NAD(P)-binding domain-containing protein [Acetobacteraceae bacterium]